MCSWWFVAAVLISLAVNMSGVECSAQEAQGILDAWHRQLEDRIDARPVPQLAKIDEDRNWQSHQRESMWELWEDQWGTDVHELLGSAVNRCATEAVSDRLVLGTGLVSPRRETAPVHQRAESAEDALVNRDTGGSGSRHAKKKERGELEMWEALNWARFTDPEEGEKKLKKHSKYC